MSSEPFDKDIIRQMSVLIYNQPAIQDALTAISRAHRQRDGLTEAGVAFVQAVTITALTFAQNPQVMAEAIHASPKSIPEAATKPGIYPAAAIVDGDVIMHGGKPRKVETAMAGRSLVRFTLVGGGELEVPPETQINLLDANNEPKI